jgi:hypothetical protein
MINETRRLLENIKNSIENGSMTCHDAWDIMRDIDAALTKPEKSPMSDEEVSAILKASNEKSRYDLVRYVEKHYRIGE